MRTLAALGFIAGAAAVAIVLARKPTVADGRVMEAEFLARLRPQGITGMACDREIPITRRGAVFACTATLRGGATQLLDCTMDRDGRLTANLAGRSRPAGGSSRVVDPRVADPRVAADPGPVDPSPAAEPSPAPEPRPDEIRTSGDPWSN